MYSEVYLFMVVLSFSPCSSVFGKQLDIHTGGIDLAFPHHENEIAQCEAYHQCERWGNYFLHSGMYPDRISTRYILLFILKVASIWKAVGHDLLLFSSRSVLADTFHARFIIFTCITLYCQSIRMPAFTRA